MTEPKERKSAPEGLWQTVLQTHALVVMRLWIWGIPLPGREAARRRLPQAIAAPLERELIVREILRRQYALPFGPLWLRRITEIGLFQWGRYRIFLLLAIKATLALALVGVPFSLFVIGRVFLPVPERVATRMADGLGDGSLPEPQKTVDWPYTFSGEDAPRVRAINIAPAGEFRGIRLEPLTETGYPPGLTQVGIQQPPFHQQQFRGFLVAENAPIEIRRQRRSFVDIAGRNRLKLLAYLFPSPGAHRQCSLRILDERQRVLAHTRQTAVAGRQPSWLRWPLLGNLVPYRNPLVSQVVEIALDINEPPPVLSISASPIVEPNSPRLNTRPPGASAEVASAWLGPATSPPQQVPDLRDVSQAECLFAVGGLSFEREVISTQQSRGMILLHVEGLSPAMANDENLAPNLHRFRTSAALTAAPVSESFTPDGAYGTLLASAPATLPRVAAQAGFHPAAFGHLTTREARVWPESLVIHSASYAPANTVAESLAWIRTHSEAPFFLLLRFNSLSGPLRPPLADINLTRWLRGPVGERGERTLRDAALLAWDREFGRLLNGLRGMGALEGTTIAVTGGAPQNASGFGDPRAPLLVSVPHAAASHPALRSFSAKRLPTLSDVRNLVTSLLSGEPMEPAVVEPLLIRGQGRVALLFPTPSDPSTGNAIGVRSGAGIEEEYVRYAAGFATQVPIRPTPREVQYARGILWQKTKDRHALSLRFEAPTRVSLALVLAPPPNAGANRIPEILRASAGLESSVQVSQDLRQVIIRLRGDAAAGDEIVVALRGARVESFESGTRAGFSGCQEGFELLPADLPWFLNHVPCLLHPPRAPALSQVVVRTGPEELWTEAPTLR